MSEFRVSPEAEAELDEIWIHVAVESGNVDIATRAVESIADRFWLLARHPYCTAVETLPRCSVTNPAHDYFPMQNVAKIRFRMSSAVVAPVIASKGRSAA
jgi:plasmid stabilization system protein ParE